MSSLGPAAPDSILEECIDELDTAVAALERFPQAALAFALRAHLAGLLSVLLERGQCTREEVKEFLAGLEAETLQAGSASG